MNDKCIKQRLYFNNNNLQNGDSKEDEEIETMAANCDILAVTALMCSIHP